MSLCSYGLSSDQYFLVNFIMSNYLGPDVYSDNPRCSASQRLAKALPPYTLNHIGSSSLTVAQLQCLYYHVLRNAKSSLLLHPNMVYMYLKGFLPLEPCGVFPQFTSFFPTKLHPQKMYSPSHEIVKGIVVIDDPAVMFLRKEELQRFRCLSRLNDIKIDRFMCLSPRCVQSRGTEQDCSRKGEATSDGLDIHHKRNSSGYLGEKCMRKKEEEAVVGGADCVVSKAVERVLGDILTEKGCSKNGEANSNGDVSDQDCVSSAELQETCKGKKEEEEAVTDHTKNGEASSNGDVSDQNCEPSAELQEACERKKEEEEADTDHTKNGEASSNGDVSDQDCDLSAELRDTCKRKKEEEEAVTDHADYGINKTPERFRETYQRKRFKNSSTKATNKEGETDQPTCMALVPVPTDTKECDSEPQVVTTGTASKGTLGPSVGVVDIGVNKVAYFFQVALPGVRRDYGEFSCEIESDGKVILEGSTTTGGKTVKRHSRVFKMNGQKLYPPGPFKLCFNLPGPVDPRLFSPNFRSDGIFEAVVIRHENS